MGGWARVFVVFCAATLLLYVVVWLIEKPSHRYANTAYGCKLSDADLDPATAKSILEQGFVPAWRSYTNRQEFLSPECWARLSEIAEGKAYSNRLKEWGQEGTSNLRWLFLLWAFVYGAGWSIGWIWRGFRRKP